MSNNGKFLLENIDIFAGSGDTMTAESALLGVSTISYNAVSNIVENFLVKNNLVKRESNPQKIVMIIKNHMESSSDKIKKEQKEFLFK